MYYDQVAAGYEELHLAEQQKKLECIAQLCTPRGVMLDLGAGTGIVSRFFEKQVTECVAVDPSSALLVQYVGKKVQAKAECLPFKDKAFDTIVSLTALHLADWKKAYREIRRVAKSDALIVVTFLRKAKQKPVKIAGFRKIYCGSDVMFIK